MYNINILCTYADICSIELETTSAHADTTTHLSTSIYSTSKLRYLSTITTHLHIHKLCKAS